MSDLEREPLEQEVPPTPTGGDYAPSVAGRLDVFQRAGGIVIPLVTTFFAFAMAMIVVAATGHNPFTTFRGIFNGTGLNWFFPWVLGQDRSDAAFNLQQTLILTTTLILTGLAVSFAFKCGLFNIGGQGQYIVGATISAWIGVSFVELSSWAHILIAVVLAALAGAAWAAIAGLLKATVGAHEVITTIMLNWIAIYVAQALVGRGGELQNKVDLSIPISGDIAEKAHLPVFWGDPVLQGAHVGLFIALAMPVVFWILLNRTTLGYEVRAVGHNPEAARYGGISVRKSYVLAMAISGGFAGLAGAMDILGWQFHLGVLDIQVNVLGYLGFDPQLAGNLTLIIQALVLLFVGADLLFLYLWQVRRKLRLPARQATTTREAA